MQKHNRTANGMPRLGYRDDRFLESGDARVLRIAAEYLQPQSRLRRAGVQNTVVFFGSARVPSREDALKNLKLAEARGRDQAGANNGAELKVARRALHMSRYYEEARELARLITRWSLSLKQGPHFLMVCSGGGPGVMEAANRGAQEAGGKSIGLNIKLPIEQNPNPYITPDLSFMFRYFFMRKLWFAQPARCLISFPGGFGTMDELFEFLTLVQTHKMGHRVSLLLYGTKFWKRAVDFDWFAEAGTIEPEDLSLLRFADSPEEAFEIVKADLTRILKVRPLMKSPFI